MKKKPFRFFWEVDPFDEWDSMTKKLFTGFPEIGPDFPVDVADSGNKIIIRADLPGFEKKDVSVRMVDNRLIIDAEQSKESKDIGDNYFRRERRYGSFHREIQLPEEVNDNMANAEMKNGVLTIEIPKVKSKVKGKKIKIK